MPIGVQCGKCGQQYEAVDSIAGKRVRCRQCGMTIDVPGLAFPPAMLSSSMLTPPSQAMLGAPYQAPMQTLRWGGMAGPGARRSGGNVSALLVVAALISLAWAGFTGFQAVRQISDLANLLDRAGGSVSLTLVLLLLLCMGQLLAAVGVVVAMGGMLARQSWAAVAGVASATVYFGLSWTWMPMVHPQMALAIGIMRDPLQRASLILLRTGLDILTQLIVPAVAVLVFAQADPRSSRRRDWPTLRLLVAAGALGWSLYAIITSWGVVDGLLTVLDMADQFNTTARVGWQFWTTLLLRVGCLLAALGVAAACVGLLLRQEWSLPTGMSAGGAYVAFALIMLVLAMTHRAGLIDLASQSRAIGMFIFLAKELLVPGCVVGYCLWAQSSDDW